ncbi:hypothetical protein Nepgr_026466 [Nepenthes gracilis]|uniref:Uncharacterized protein n=1 Tax=Nepenthes gracilis TaxID=150966 RepID=A0AAD3T861_NEPGR|nr:hypothetical protein Nepgr_026466 [Nepenthes gracilis]
MFKLSPRRNQRSKGFKVKHVLQLCVLLGVGIWLLYQIQNSHNKKAVDEEGSKVSEKLQDGFEKLKLGRKDLHPHDAEEKNQEEEEDETRHESGGTEAIDDLTQENVDGKTEGESGDFGVEEKEREDSVENGNEESREREIDDREVEAKETELKEERGQEGEIEKEDQSKEAEENKENKEKESEETGAGEGGKDTGENKIGEEEREETKENEKENGESEKQESQGSKEETEESGEKESEGKESVEEGNEGKTEESRTRETESQSENLASLDGQVQDGIEGNGNAAEEESEVGKLSSNGDNGDGEERKTQSNDSDNAKEEKSITVEENNESARKNNSSKMAREEEPNAESNKDERESNNPTANNSENHSSSPQNVTGETFDSQDHNKGDESSLGFVISEKIIETQERTEQSDSNSTNSSGIPESSDTAVAHIAYSDESGVSENNSDPSRVAYDGDQGTNSDHEAGKQEWKENDGSSRTNGSSDVKDNKLIDSSDSMNQNDQVDSSDKSTTENRLQIHRMRLTAGMWSSMIKSIL